MTKNVPSPILVLLALITVQILFGVNYVVSKVVVEAFPPLVWASARIIVSAGIMLWIAQLSGTDSPRGKEFFGPLVIFALLGIIINQSSFLVGLRYTTATNSAILNTLIPIVTFAIVTIRGQEKLTPTRALGFVFAFGGVLIMRKIEDFSLSDQTLIGDLLTILNCVSYGFFLAYSKSFFERYSRMWTTAWLFLYGSVGLTVLALPDWIGFKMPELSPLLVGCMAFGVIGATLLTYFLNFWALAYANASSVAIFIYLQPIVAAALAWLWFGDSVTLRTTLASLLIFAGVLLVMKVKKPPQKEA
ncbi:MAG TPA: DMT family transporter [Bdellovibrionota bacterium]|nr:DMT family transporter [Bdellovibrionota bacterium]